MVPVVSSLIVALSLADAAGPATPVPPFRAKPGAVTLDVPYVPQTEALCGGAAVAMVLRYWGASHTGVEEFATLVDRRAHGIVTDALVRAVEQRNWRARRLSGSVEMLRAELADARPIVVLIEDRPRRYHYVVVVGADADGIVIHDPAWGPSRRIAAADLERRWAPTGFWSLVIQPDEKIAAVRAKNDVRIKKDVRLKADTTYETTYDACDDVLARAIDRVQREGLALAEVIFGSARAQCPRSAGPLRELAGVRFAERRWRDAAALAEQAVAMDSRDEYAWDVLGSTRFMQDDIAGALRAWNQIGKPRVDAVRIEGLTRTRYALVVDALKLPTGTLLTAERFERAERRLNQLPDTSGARLDYRLESDGFARVDVALVQSPVRPHGAAEWAARGVRAAIDREVSASIPGTSGGGEMWSASWRWWSNRPRAALSFATPHPGVLPGVWRVDASWDRQTYQSNANIAPIREERLHGGLSIADWATANLRYELTAGIDSWNGTRRAASLGGSIERRAFGDRLSTAAAAATWIPLATQTRFHAGGLRTTFRSSTKASGMVWLADGGLETVSMEAPMSLWVGAGDGQSRAPLLRAHPLLSDGIVTGSIFGRRLAYGNTELQRWITSSPVRVAVATFVDVARASRRASSAIADPFQVDAGAGIRVKVPGQKGTVRVDFGRGLRDRSHALTVGWQY